MDSFISTERGPGTKKNTPHKVMALLFVHNEDGQGLDCEEDSTIDYKNLVSQPKDSMYYSETEEEKIVEE